MLADPCKGNGDVTLSLASQLQQLVSSLLLSIRHDADSMLQVLVMLNFDSQLGGSGEPCANWWLRSSAAVWCIIFAAVSLSGDQEEKVERW